MTDRDEFVSASELARMGYCERQVAFDASHGQRVTVQQDQARDRGLKAHAAFYDESRRIAAASATKGRRVRLERMGEPPVERTPI